MKVSIYECIRETNIGWHYGTCFDEGLDLLVHSEGLILCIIIRVSAFCVLS